MGSSDSYDLVIVGLGPAGLYAGWRLATTDPEHTILGKPAHALRVGLFETQPESQVGGRLCTQPMPGYPFLAELGGMRYRDTQLLVKGLVRALGLSEQVRPFAFPQYFYYLRGRRLLEQQLKTKSRNPYHLAETEGNRLPADLIAEAIHNILRDLDFGLAFSKSRAASWGIKPRELLDKIRTPSGIRELTHREWAVVKCLAEYHSENFLYDVGFWDLLQFYLSSEAWHLAHDGLGYESIMGNWNAAIALPWFLSDFSSDKAFTLTEGMSSITRKMHQVILRTSNYECEYDWDLTGIDISTDSGDSTSPTFHLQFGTPDRTVTSITTRAVVLALPKGALIRLNYGKDLIARAHAPHTSLDKRSWFMDQLNSVDGKALFKLFLGYDKPWWQTRGVKSATGKVNTDLPLRQVFYYGPDKWSERRALELGLDISKNSHSMLMASYSDSHYIEFWSELERRKAWLPYYAGADGGASLSAGDQGALERFGAPMTMLLRAEHQLGLLHQRKLSDSVPLARVGLYMEWSRAPYYAGWHAWKVGAEPWDVSTKLMRPFLETDLFVCGEAYSDEQGWTEGALKSTERLLSERFDLPLPHVMLDQEFEGDSKKLQQYVSGWAERVGQQASSG